MENLHNVSECRSELSILLGDYGPATVITALKQLVSAKKGMWKELKQEQMVELYDSVAIHLEVARKLLHEKQTSK
jgi:hypothetical protein